MVRHPLVGRIVEAYEGPGKMMLEIALEADEERTGRSWEPLVRSAAEAAVAGAPFPSSQKQPLGRAWSVRLASDEEVRGLNAHWRGKDKPTNVLSFLMAEQYELEQSERRPDDHARGPDPRAWRVRAREAAEKGVSVEQHGPISWSTARCTFSAMITASRTDAADMEAREVRALARLGIADP